MSKSGDMTRRGILVGLGTTMVAGGAVGAHSRSGGEYESTDVLDLFVGAGQSNAVGRGDESESPTPEDDTAFEFEGDELDELEDPVGGHWDGTEEADSGSMWPAFCDEYVDLTGRHVGFVVIARGKTAQSAAADGGAGNWDTGGDYRSLLVEATTDAIEYLDDHDYAVNLGGVVWSQGERDARRIDTDDISVSTYRRALTKMIAHYRAELDPSLPFHVVQTGYDAEGDTDGYRAVRDAQAEVVWGDPNTYLASTLAKNFPETEKMSDRYHYTQGGYNELGRDAARTTADNLLVKYQQ